jgi:hypothetical protein
MQRNLLRRCGIAGTTFLLLLQGYMIGRIADVRLASATPVSVIPDPRPPVAVVHINAIRNGLLEGDLTGDVRFFLGGEQVLAESSGAFRVPADVFLRNAVTVTVPRGMYFVASKKGKKYYPVTSSAGERIAPQNRVYFPTAEQAERAGYVP